MNKQSIVKIITFIFIAVLLLLIGHCFLHGLERDDGDCSLCDILAMGFTGIEQFGFLLVVFFIAIISQIKLLQFIVFSHLQIQLRAPPCHSNL
jgi:hypothetical protein